MCPALWSTIQCVCVCVCVTVPEAVYSHAGFYGRGRRKVWGAQWREEVVGSHSLRAETLGIRIFVTFTLIKHPLHARFCAGC